MSSLLLIHFAATWFMTGLIWMIQLVHYPLFANVGAMSSEQYLQYQKSHMTRIGFIVGPVMVVEFVTAGLLLLELPPALAWTNLALLLLIWLSTACLQVPCHRRLAISFDVRLIQRLVRGNWLRTALWSGRGLMLSAAVLG